jgi:subtilisin family serine protease
MTDLAETGGMRRRRSLGLVIVASSVLALVSSMFGLAPAASAATQPLSLLVVHDTTTSSTDVVATLHDAGVSVSSARSLPQLSTTKVVVPSNDGGDAIAALNDEPGISSVNIDPVVHAVSIEPNDPGWVFEDGFRRANVDAAWSTTTGSPSTLVAVLDTGVTPNADLAGRVVAGSDYVNGDSDPSDDNGHGTAVASILAGAGNDGQGVAGVCWQCRVLAIKVLGADGSGNESDVSSGVVEAVDKGAKVINMSLASPDDSPTLDSAIAYATAHDVIVFGAAGNDGVDTVMYPADSPGVVSVGGTDAGRAMDGQSNFGAWVDIAASWCNVEPVGTDLFNFCGTSSATPLAAGVAALLRSAIPTLTAPQTATSLESTAVPITPVGSVASGEIDANAALQFAVAHYPPPDRPPTGVIEPPGGFLMGTPMTYVDVADDHGVSSVQLFADGAPLTKVSGAFGLHARVGVAWSTLWHPDGPVTLQALVTDSVGHRSWSAPVGGRIDNNPPGVLIVSPHNGARIGTNYAVYLGSADPNGVVITLVAANGRIIGGAPRGGIFGFPANAGHGGRITIIAAAMDAAGHIGFSNFVTVTAPRR